MSTRILACTLPIGAPIGRSWEEINSVLDDSFRLATHAANWCVQQLYRRDTIGQTATPDVVKMGQASKGRFYAYGEAKAQPFFTEWAGAKQGLNIVLQYAHREYLRRRFDVMVRGNQSLLTVRHPYPFPVDADGVKLSYADGGFPVAALQLPGLGSVPFRLKRRADFGRQLAMFRQLHDGVAEKREAALYRNGKGDLMVKLVGKFPAREPGPLEHVCLLHTDPAAFLVAEIDGRLPVIWNADHLRRWQAVHKSYRQRVSEDAKREKRMDRRMRYHLNKSRTIRCDKHNERIGTAIHQLTAQVAQFCERQKVACVVYDDAVRDYIPEFPWHQVKEYLHSKLDALGISLIGFTDVDHRTCFLKLEGAEKWNELLKLASAMAIAGRRLVSNRRRRADNPHPAVSTLRAT